MQQLPNTDPHATLALSRFRARRADRGPLFRSFCERGDIPLHVRKNVQTEPVYAFPWGFVSESALGGGYVWCLHVESVWTSGTKPWWPRFTQAHRQIVEPETHALYRPGSRDGIYVTYIDGSTPWAAAAYGCLLGNQAERGRVWFADRFLPDLWPKMLETVAGPGALTDLPATLRAPTILESAIRP